MAIFRYVAEFQSFSQAARKLGLPKSFVSRNIASYEKELGVRLFERTSHATRLTEAGAALLERARPILDASDAAESFIKSFQSAPKGVLRVAASTDLGLWLARDFFTGFARRYPSIRVELDLSYRFVDLVKEGYDVGIRVGNLPSSSLVLRRLTTTHSALYASPQYIAQHGQPRLPRDLAGHRFIGFTGSNFLRKAVLRKGNTSFVLEERADFSCDLLQGVKAAALGGLGIMLFPERLTRDEVSSGQLLPILPGFRTQATKIQVVYPERRQLNAKTRVFLDAICSYRGLW